MIKFKDKIKIIVCLIKSLLAGFTQVIWSMVAIIIFRGQVEEMLMYRPDLFDKMLSTIFNGWFGLFIALTIFYMFVNLKEIREEKND